MRVVSLLPAATEIIAALGMLDALVAVSHECDFPASVTAKPRATRCEIHGNALPSADTDAWVRRQLAERGTRDTLDEALLRRLDPTPVVPQRHCPVCAVEYAPVAAFAQPLPSRPHVVNLEPERLADVLGDVRRVGRALGVPERAVVVVGALETRMAALRARVAGAVPPRCALLEWVDPPYRGGHWMPELVELAGATDLLGRVGEKAVATDWATVRATEPELLVLACCGYDVARTFADRPLLEAVPGWRDIPAVRAGRVWAVNGSAYFSRPGPRLVDSAELLAALAHPERFPVPSPDAARALPPPRSV
jgi:iron complex transport system substrate-binding protein